MRKKIYLLTAFVVVFSSQACNNSAGKIEENPLEKVSVSLSGPAENNIVELTEEQIKTAGIESGPIQNKYLSATLKVSGEVRVANSNKAQVTTLFTGNIQSLGIETGDYVKKGQVIAVISNPQFIQIQEEYLTIKNRMELALKEMERQETLVKSDAGSIKQLQIAHMELSSLKIRKASLDKQIQLMGINTSHLSNMDLHTTINIRSPISGVVTAVYAKLGSFADVSTPIAEIIENTALHLDFHVFEKDIAHLKKGQTVEFVVTNKPAKKYAAEVYNIGASINPANKTIEVHSKIRGNKNGLIDGMNITGLISLDNILSPAVPEVSIVSADGKYYIFLVKEEVAAQENSPGKNKLPGITRFERMEIIKGNTQLDYTAIQPVRGHLPEDVRVVTKGAFFVNAKMIDYTETGQLD